MSIPESRVASIIELGERLIRNFSGHCMATYAAALAYRGLFALLPFMLIFVVLVGMLGSPDSIDRLIGEAKSQSSQQVPRQLQPVVEQGKEQILPLEELIEQARRQAEGGFLLFGIAVALWSVSALAGTLADAFDTAYGVTETRRGWRRFALTLASGPVIALAMIVATVLMLTGPRVVERIAEVAGLRDLSVLLWGWLRFPVAFFLLAVVLSVVYRHGSSARQSYRSVVLGAALAVVAWAVASVGFSIYLANFVDYGVTYGSLGAAVGLLLYLYLTASIVLVGAEVNVAVHHSPEDRTIQAKKPGLDREISTTRDERTRDA